MDPQEIFADISITVKHYLDQLNTYTEEQFNYRSAEGSWSLGQMYEHLALSSFMFFLANTKRCLEKRKGKEEGAMNEHGRALFAVGSFPAIKIKMPEAVAHVPVARPLAIYKEELQRIVIDAQAMIEPLSQDTGQYKTYHPVFGWLSANEWYKMLEMHLRHHLRQQAELESALA